MDNASILKFEFSYLLNRVQLFICAKFGLIKSMKKLLFLVVGICMNINICRSEPAFDVIGITVRCSTQEAIRNNTIGKLWQRFFEDQIFTKIPNKIDTTLIALYYDFESDKTGEYTTLIGVRVSSDKEVPSGMVVKHVPADNREVFLTEQGPMGQVVFGTWQKIWQLEDAGKLKHSYTVDYELYDERSRDLQNAQVEIHVGVKP